MNMNLSSTKKIKKEILVPYLNISHSEMKKRMT